MNPRLFRTRRYATPVNYRSESVALFAAMAVQLSNPQKVVVDDVMDQWIIDGVFGSAARIWVPCLVTEQQSLLNWKNPAGTALIANGYASSFVSKIGFPGNPANSTYLETDFTPSTDGGSLFTLTNSKVMAYIKDNLQDDGYTLGGVSGGDILIRQRDTGNNFIGRVNNSQSTTSGITDSRGLWSVATDGTNCIKKRNGTTLDTTASATTTLCSGKQYIGAWNDNPSPLNFLNNTVQCVIYGQNTIDDASVKSGVEYILANL